MIMRELFIKYFGRILAILGCSTVVTACYGVPTASYVFKGKVVDAETGNPIKGILVSVGPGYGQGTSQENGSYETSSGSFPMERSQDFLVEMQPKK